jgi:hypothetical protein
MPRQRMAQRLTPGSLTAAGLTLKPLMVDSLMAGLLTLKRPTAAAAHRTAAENRTAAAENTTSS